MRVQTCVYTCVDTRCEPPASLLRSCTSYWPRQGFPLTHVHLSRLARRDTCLQLVSREPQGSISLHLISIGVMSTCQHAQILKWVVGIKSVPRAFMTRTSSIVMLRYLPHLTETRDTRQEETLPRKRAEELPPPDHMWQRLCSIAGGGSTYSGQCHP